MPERLALPSTRARCAAALGWKHITPSVKHSRQTHTGIDPADGRRREIPAAVRFQADPDFHLRAEALLGKLAAYPGTRQRVAAVRLELVTIIDEAVTFALAVKPERSPPPPPHRRKARRLEPH